MNVIDTSAVIDVLTHVDDTEPLRARVFALSAYDAAFVAVAEALGCPLVNRDARLARSTGHDAEIRFR